MRQTSKSPKSEDSFGRNFQKFAESLCRGMILIMYPIILGLFLVVGIHRN